MELTPAQQKTLDKLKAETDAAIQAQTALPASERVKPMPADKTAYPIGVEPEKPVKPSFELETE